MADSTVMSLEDWKNDWEERKIDFHKTHVHSLLVKHIDKLINGRKNVKIFVPLCGKSVDMKWLWEQGHTIVGVEIAEMAIKEFFAESSIKFTTSSIPNIEGTLYTSEDNRIKLYCCDFYSFDSKCEGSMDAIYDRGSLVAINVEDRKKYSSALKNLMGPDCRSLFELVDYDENKFGGPPHYISFDQMKELFGDRCNVKDVEKNDIYVEKIFKPMWGIDYLFEHWILLTMK